MKACDADMREVYFFEKDVSERYKMLKRLLCDMRDMPAGSKDFFLRVFRKERHLDMKLCAVRGYAVYASEDEVCVLMSKLLELLIKRQEKRMYDYSEYEAMRSVFLMPYLLERYDYSCFRVFSEQLEKQYDDMPDCFKNIFTLDKQGNVRRIRDPMEVKCSLEEYMRNTNK